MAKVKFWGRATDDRAAIFSRIASDNLKSAIDVDEAIEVSCRLLSDNSGVGPLCGFRRPEFADCRFWPTKKYKDYQILYRPAAEGIEVLRIIHGARDFQRFESRLF